MAVAGGIAAALVVATLPHVYLENIVGATSLSEIIPAAAPPLGNTARGLIAVFAGMISASALYLFLNHKTKSHEGGSDMSLALRKNLTTEPVAEEREGKSRFSVPKLNLSAKSLTKFLKKPKKAPGQVTELKDLPDVRSADRHPDAPVRQPIFASSDLGTPLAESIKRFDNPEVDQKAAEPVKPSAAPLVKPDPFAAEKAPEPVAEEKPEPVRSDNQAQPTPSGDPREDLSALSLSQLADRLEAGLRRLEALENRARTAPLQAPVESAPAPVEMAPVEKISEEPAPVAIPPLRSVESVESDPQASRQADMDAALKAALGTLEKMTAQR
ncbi:hypothetical protein [Sphingorhabdus sp. YGSMI21]|uniref:hypothetical protein n=1 Tax=Sphingorhabdus sp. YGSMI21 TaxID=2077182 RepID=UPI000F4EBCD4|nr:hypothetical protein [Sphingorhabdus sp. YGSMI21]